MIRFIECVQRSLAALDLAAVGRIVSELVALRDRGGRLFILGNGGGAAHASHAAADFRTLCGIEAYCPSDNAANLTALTNDEGFENAYAAWLRASRYTDSQACADALMVVSVGGGSESPPVSQNIVNGIRMSANVLGIVGRDGGYTAQHSRACVVIPCDRPDWVTPVVEGVQAVVLHMIVSDPRLQRKKAKWESVTR